MKERPILFNGAMVRALRNGSKTQTRRVCKPAANLCAVVAVQDPNQKPIGQRPPYLTPGWFGDEDGEVQFFSPYGQPSDRLWVRESFAHIYRGNATPAERRTDDVVYMADGFTPDAYVYGSWKPSIHMPRWASRITLEIVSVRVERLQDISEADAIAEGIGLNASAIGVLTTDDNPTPLAVAAYRSLWESINGAGSWAANPWVWVVEFKRVAS